MKLASIKPNDLAVVNNDTDLGRRTLLAQGIDRCSM